MAGLTVAAFLVPQVLAYAGVAGLPAVTGLWAALAALGCYALLGSSRQLSLGPESTTALLTASTVGPLAAGDPHRYAAIAAALAVLVGAICLLGRLARLGFLADMLSRPVLVGYLTGIALIMIAGQLENVTGVPVEGGAFLPIPRRSRDTSGSCTARHSGCPSPCCVPARSWSELCCPGYLGRWWPCSWRPR
jgi:sulfate permease, SulP family